MDGVDAVVNFAAETHVDRSIAEPDAFITTHALGTFVLLEAARARGVRYVQVSTDEVYGSIESGSFTEQSPLQPSSPYSATKAGADLLVASYHHTYGLEALICRGSNNYGPFQYPEKLIPLMVLNALHGDPLPVYGDGQQVRNWIFVEDFARGIGHVLAHGVPGRDLQRRRARRGGQPRRRPAHHRPHGRVGGPDRVRRRTGRATTAATRWARRRRARWAGSRRCGSRRGWSGPWTGTATTPTGGRPSAPATTAPTTSGSTEGLWACNVAEGEREERALAWQAKPYDPRSVARQSCLPDEREVAHLILAVGLAGDLRGRLVAVDRDVVDLEVEVVGVLDRLVELLLAGRPGGLDLLAQRPWPAPRRRSPSRRRSRRRVWSFSTCSATCFSSPSKSPAEDADAGAARRRRTARTSRRQAVGRGMLRSEGSDPASIAARCGSGSTRRHRAGATRRRSRCARTASAGASTRAAGARLRERRLRGRHGGGDRARGRHVEGHVLRALRQQGGLHRRAPRRRHDGRPGGDAPHGRRVRRHRRGRARARGHPHVPRGARRVPGRGAHAARGDHRSGPARDGAPRPRVRRVRVLHRRGQPRGRRARRRRAARLARTTRSRSSAR